MKTRTAFGTCLTACLLMAMPSSHGFQVLPKISDVDRKLSRHGEGRRARWISQFVADKGVPLLKSPVHEAATLAALGCDRPAGDELDCLEPDAVLDHRMILYGVRWPDDPPFRMDPANPPESRWCNARVTLRSTAQPACWLTLFQDAGRRAATHQGPGAAFGPGTMLLYRSHYGDLQFLHAMASHDGETAVRTKANAMMWAEFMWGIATERLRTDVPLRDLGVEGLGEYFPGDMTTTNLLATGIVEARRHLDEVALGVILHMVQDSFSAAHANRALSSGGTCDALPDFEAPGRVESFNSYARQDSSLHDDEDTPGSLALHTIQEIPNAVTASGDVIRLWREKAEWSAAEKYFDCAFDLVEPDAPAGPGRFAAR